MTRSADPVQPSLEPALQVGVIGLGYWGPNLVRCLSHLAGAEVRWICDLDGDRLERYAAQYPRCRSTGDAEDLFSDPELDAVMIATPVYSHFDLARRSLEAGKHTFVEKPLAPSVEMADQLLYMADERDLMLMCGHTFLYSPPVKKVKALMDRDELGKLFFISSSRVNLGLHQRDVSVIWDLAPHDFSILLWWLGEMPSTVRAVGRDCVVAGIADVAFVTLTFPSGVVANVELSWLSPSKLRRTVVVGSKKMVVYEDGVPEPLRVFDHGVIYEDPETFGEYHLSYRTGDVLSPKLETHEPLSMELADFLEQARSGERSKARGRLARDVVRLTEAADLSLSEGGAEVTLTGPRFRRRAPAPAFSE